MNQSVKNILIATRNSHKIGEIRAILGPQFSYHHLGEFPGSPTPVEDAATFAGNATKKAVTLANWVAERGIGGIDHVLADDSGLETDALNGAPGVHSARFAALETGKDGNSSDRENNDKLLKLLQNVPAEKRTGRFCCVIAFTPVPSASSQTASPVCSLEEAEAATMIFEGSCEGLIGFAPSGGKGFGYDPLFTPHGFDKTFSELGEEIKNKISHRAQALFKLREYLSK